MPIFWGSPVAGRLGAVMRRLYTQLAAASPNKMHQLDASWIAAADTAQLRALSRDFFVSLWMYSTGCWPRCTDEARKWLACVYLHMPEGIVEVCHAQESILMLSIQRMVDEITQDEPMYYVEAVPKWGHFSFMSASRQANLRRLEPRPGKDKTKK